MPWEMSIWPNDYCHWFWMVPNGHFHSCYYRAHLIEITAVNRVGEICRLRYDDWDNILTRRTPRSSDSVALEKWRNVIFHLFTDRSLFVVAEEQEMGLLVTEVCLSLPEKFCFVWMLLKLSQPIWPSACGRHNDEMIRLWVHNLVLPVPKCGVFNLP